VKRDRSVIKEEGEARGAFPAPPDARLVALVRLLARHAASQDHEEALREGDASGNAEDSTAEKEP
jgi:hypothetical protein